MKSSSIMLFIFIIARSAELDQVRSKGTKNSLYFCECNVTLYSCCSDALHRA